MSTENPTLTFPAEPDYGVWSRAVDRVVDRCELDYYPSEELVAELVLEMGLTDPDEGDQMEALEDALIDYYL